MSLMEFLLSFPWYSYFPESSQSRALNAEGSGTHDADPHIWLLSCRQFCGARDQGYIRGNLTASLSAFEVHNARGVGGLLLTASPMSKLMLHSLKVYGESKSKQ